MGSREREKMGGGMKAVLGEAMPCASMVVVEGRIIALTIMASIALAKGMSPFVFVVYTNALASIILLPNNRSEEAWLTRSFLQQVFFLGLIGSTRFEWKRSGSMARLIGTLISL